MINWFIENGEGIKTIICLFLIAPIFIAGERIFKN